MPPYLPALAGLVALLVAGAAEAAGKKEGSGESGGSAVAPIASGHAGPRELFIPTDQASDSIGNVAVTATMMAGAGAGKCRMNFIVNNYSTAAIAMGALASALNDKDEVTDNWVISIGSLAVGGQTTRLFSCALGAVQLRLVPTGEFGWPPLKCAKGEQEPESCPLGLSLKSNLPLVEKK
ncbi:hypothetical protein [Magnetospirillum sp. SS-4]|uniref:hypothetical protein n=1 Tax=Magnetospirillum sp. SS-4 TaxID=2681465 RepID=UPI00137FB715|nr:hypothetical protein [Magnetospirillum sp. SS-4]CAA7612858.1 conserved exported hypothetical protein [Magnetospirillum sp. SS-4]